jgi:ferritin-like metal-binding protein YciE
MEKSANSLPLQKFINTLSIVEKLETLVNKIYKKMETAAFTPELAKCLSPVSTDYEQHLKRIGLIKQSFKQKPDLKDNEPKPFSIKLIKQSAEQDLDIIANALKLQNEKLAYYEFLYPLASALEMPQQAELLEQTITDNRNTNTWLRQIMQNIIVPRI